ncbi:MAG: hypothetical protein M3Y91_09975 [Actinomycetota bacterium]|nr:hypothetical protein [Actinomycetota bacterium]
MITVSKLRGFDGGTYTAITTKLGTAVEALNSAQGSISGAGGQMTYWQGPAADAANATMANLVTVVSSAPAVLSTAQDAVAAFVAAVSQQKVALDGLVHQVPPGCHVAEDGTVSVPPGQPTNQPPQMCFTDPAQEAARINAQNAYDSAMSAWQAAKAKAAQLQTQIQQVLQQATAADSRATADLDAAIKGGTDVGKIIAGQDAGGSYATNLWNDAQNTDAQKWVQSFVNQAASLLPQAAKGDHNAVATLGTLADLSHDQTFSASLMNKLGAKGLEALPVAMGENMNNQRSIQDAQNVYNSNHSVLGFLANSLASASNSLNLDPTFAQSLIATADHNAKDLNGSKPSSGYWGLGQILGAASGQPPFEAQFLNTVGTGIINWDKQNQQNGLGHGMEYTGPYMFAAANNLNLSPQSIMGASLPMMMGHLDSGGSPMYGLMHAAAVSPLAAQALFAPRYGGGENPNLNYVLTGTPWTYDKGASLGSALQAATAGPSTTTTAGITSNMVHTLATQYKMNSGYADQMSALRPAVANILSQKPDIAAVNMTIEGYPNSTTGSRLYPGPGGSVFVAPTFNGVDLARVLGVVSQDKSAYSTLQAGQVGYLNSSLNQAVIGYKTSHDPSGIEQSLNKGTSTLAFLGGVKTLIAQDGANANEAAFQHSLATAKYITQGLSSVANIVPGGQVVGIPSGIAATVLADVGGASHASTQPTTTGDAQELSLAGFSRIALANALINNQVATPSVLPGNPPFYQNGPAGPTLLPAQDFVKNGDAMGSLMQWLEKPGTTGSENFNQIVTDHLVTGNQLAALVLGASGG